jgi:hypothetical protein
MSKEQKSGEDLIEKVEQEAVEQVETKEESSSFDAKAFAGEEVKEEIKETEEESPQENQETQEESSEDVGEDGFDWGSAESEEKYEEPKEEDWDPQPKAEKQEVKESVQEAVYDWEALGKELGINAKNEAEFKNAVKNVVKESVPVTDAIKNMESFLKMTDKSLVKADLEASGLDKAEIDDTVDRLVDSGLLKREAVMIRKNLQTYIATEKEKIAQEEMQMRQEEEQMNLNTRKSLQKYIKGKKDFFGGKVKTADKKELYNYITNGGFSKEVFSNVANVADIAFLWKYKDKIFNMLRGQGMESGKASVINKITNPDLGRRSRHTDVKPKSGFDPVEFMK